jgi:hypothetical protein
MTGFASKRAMSAQAFMRMVPNPSKIIWHQLPGRKLKATWLPSPKSFELGLRESDMDPIQQWCKDSNCGKRISFDMFQFNSDKQITMFLLRWSS